MRLPSVIFRAAVGVFTMLACAVVQAEAVGTYEGLWYLGGHGEPGRKVSLQVQGEREAPADAVYTWTCAIESKLEYRNALVTLKVKDTDGKVVVSGEQTMPLAQRANRCTFEMNPATLAPGRYTAEFEIQATDKEPAAKYIARIRRVSAADLAAQLAEAQQRLAAINTVDGQKPSYSVLRVRIAKDVAAQAAADAAAGKWRLYAEKVDYSVDVARGAGAGIALSGLMPETAQAPEDPSLAEVHTERGGYAAGGKPVFLVGTAVSNAADAAQARRYGLNYGVVTIHPADALAPGSDNDLSAAYGPLFQALGDANLAAGVGLDAGGLAGWPLERMPKLNESGFVNLAREEAQALAARHLKATLPFLAAQRGVAAVSLLDNPQFKFEGEPIHRQFIEQVQTLYPDRQQLNALWSAHLASYNDITVWGHYIDGRPDPKIPDHHYEKKRAYTFDWTAFHLGLMADYLERTAAAARALAPSLPLGVTLPDTAFDKNETTYSPDRERVARAMDYVNFTVTAGPLDPIYSLAYPHASASIALEQSFAPEKPLNVDRFNIALDEAMEPEALYDFVQSLVWTSVIDGADALALPAGSDVLARPAALEAYATAAIDLNRLAPIVRALQQAPTDVAILYSDSSKILDGGDPHLKSCSFAYEGASFAGLTVRFISERQCMDGVLDAAHIVILPATPALRGDTFKKIEGFVDGGGVAARVGSPIPYDEHGRSRTSVIRNTGKTIIVRGFNLPTEYLHAMDGVNEFDRLPPWPRPVNGYDYPIEGVKTRFVELDGVPYLYLVNLRKEAVNCFLSGSMQNGRDLLRGHDVAFPAYVEPLHPMLIRLDANEHKAVAAPVSDDKKKRRDR